MKSHFLVGGSSCHRLSFLAAGSKTPSCIYYITITPTPPTMWINFGLHYKMSIRSIKSYNGETTRSMTNACLGLKKKDGGDESKPTFNTGSLTKSVDFKLTQPL